MCEIREGWRAVFCSNTETQKPTVLCLYSSLHTGWLSGPTVIKLTVRSLSQV